MLTPIVKTGERFGEWEVLVGGDYRVKDRVPCRCSCGAEHSVSYGHLRYGRSSRCARCGAECGARYGLSRKKEKPLKKPKAAAKPRLKGSARPTVGPLPAFFLGEYRRWQAMHARCNPKAAAANPNYAGRGIRVEPEWDSFWDFLRDIGLRPEGTSIDRVDTNGNYCRSNCRWATSEQQMNNRRCTLKVETEDGHMTLAQYAKSIGVPYAQAWSKYRSAAKYLYDGYDPGVVKARGPRGPRRITLRLESAVKSALKGC